MGNKFKVGISGSYGGFNLGDEAILQSIIGQLRDSAPVEITVFSRNAEKTRERRDVDKAVPVRNLLRNEVVHEIKGLDLFILGGGGILFDGEAEIFMREVTLAHDLGVPVMVYAVSAGPLKKRAVIDLVREGLNAAAAITVRDRGARRILEDIGVTRDIQITADPALLLAPEQIGDDILLKERMNGNRRLVGISVREPGPAAPDIDRDFYHGLLANAADYMVDRYDADVVFIPMEHHMQDLQNAHAVLSKMLKPQHAWVIKGDYTPGQVLTLVRRLDFALGMRLHFLIFAALGNIPFVALPYSSKVLDFVEAFEISMPPINLVNAGRLIAHIDYSWDTQDILRARIKRSLPGMQDRARLNNRIALDVLHGDYDRPGKSADRCDC